jgi:Lsr2
MTARSSGHDPRLAGRAGLSWMAALLLPRARPAACFPVAGVFAFGPDVSAIDAADEDHYILRCAEELEVTTLRQGLDGAEYEIDLSTEHSGELRKALEKYISHARRTGGTARRAARGSVR